MTASPLARAAHAVASALADAGIQAQALNVRRGPRLCSIEVALWPFDVARVLRMGTALARACDRRRVRLAETGRGVAVEVELPRAMWEPLTVSMVRTYRGECRAVVLGRNIRGLPVMFTFDNPATPHLFVVGATGSGKTTALQAILWQLAVMNPPDALALVLIDGLASGLAPFADVPHLALPLAATPDAGAAAIAAVCAELDARIADPARRTPLVVVVDELSRVTDGRDATGAGLARIAATGRGLGVHAILATQHATVAVVSRLVSVNITTRLVGKVADAAASRLAMGSDRDAARTLAGAGDMLLCRGDDVRRVQVPVVTADEWAMLPVRGPGTLLKNQAHFTLPLDAPRNAVEKSSAPHAGHTPRQTTADEVGRVAALWRGDLAPGILKVRGVLGCGDGRAKRVRDEAATLLANGGMVRDGV